MSFPILLQGKNKTIDTTALIDFGATRNFMDMHLLSLDGFTLIHLPNPIITYNIDWTKNQKGTIHWQAKTILTLEDHSDPIELMILWLSKPWVILGMPWLKRWNPKIIGTIFPWLYLHLLVLTSLIMPGILVLTWIMNSLSCSSHAPLLKMTGLFVSITLGRRIRRTDQQDHNLNKICPSWQTQGNPCPWFLHQLHRCLLWKDL